MTKHYQYQINLAAGRYTWLMVHRYGILVKKYGCNPTDLQALLAACEELEYNDLLGLRVGKNVEGDPNWVELMHFYPALVKYYEGRE